MAEDAAQNLIMTRRELESYVQELHDLKEPLTQAAAREDPVPMTLSQIRNTITALEGLKPRIFAAQQFLVRQETEEDPAAQDAENKRRVLKDWDQAREQAFCLKYIAEALQHVKTVT